MSLARVAGWLAIVLALVLGGLTVRDELAGVTDAQVGSRAVLYSGVLISKSEFPEQFRRNITFKWYRALACLGAGVLLLALAKRADSLDPFSPSFSGNQALDDWGESLTEKEKEAKAAKARANSQAKDPE